MKYYIKNISMSWLQLLPVVNKILIGEDSLCIFVNDMIEYKKKKKTRKYMYLP